MGAGQDEEQSAAGLAGQRATGRAAAERNAFVRLVLADWVALTDRAARAYRAIVTPAKYSS